jgi:hypothetical protein
MRYFVDSNQQMLAFDDDYSCAWLINFKNSSVVDLKLKISMLVQWINNA